jgi:hypothetical protein
MTHVAGRDPLALALAAFLVVFATTRLYTRLARVRGWGSGSIGGVHLHHDVVGILLVLAAGTLLIGFMPDGLPLALLSICFGAGAALILDEFALVLHLEDVYWQEEGRSSIDAVAIAVAVGALVLLHVVPFDPGDAGVGDWALAGYVGFNVLAVVVAASKGKLVTALFGVFLPLVGLVGAIRLAKPDSMWARHFYRPGSRRRARSVARFGRQHRRLDAMRRRLEDLVGGRPSDEPPSVSG